MISPARLTMSDRQLAVIFGITCWDHDLPVGVPVAVIIECSHLFLP